jgi:hypothetical protein
MTGSFLFRLDAPYRRLSHDACAKMAPLYWPERVYFLAAAGVRHEAWRSAIQAAGIREAVPEWSSLVSAIIELWSPLTVERFETAAIFSLSDCREWRLEADTWCRDTGLEPQLSQFLVNPMDYAAGMVERQTADCRMAVH